MLGLMFWLNWDFTLIALGVTPFLLLFVSRFKKAVKKATHEVRKEQSDIVAVVQQGLESMQVIKAFGRQELQQKQLGDVSHATVERSAESEKDQISALSGGHHDSGWLYRRGVVACIVRSYCTT